MKRAAIVIGVDKTGQLPKLNDAAKGAERFAQWARDQGMDPVELITDAHGRVTLQRIKDAVREVVDRGTIEQLSVYFAGHGVNIRYSEYWLLSDAPRDTQAAVNVAGSATLARYCGIPHVVFISDACRTAAEGVQAQGVTGGEIFPNEGGSGLEMAVDQFFACTLGRPAHEIKDPNITSQEYQALYTGVLLDALHGRPESLVDWINDETGFVRPRPLKEQLYDRVTQKIARAHLQTKLIQIPDARITSDATAWLAQLNKADLKPERRTKGKPKPRIPVPESPAAVSEALIGSALTGESPTNITRSVELVASPALGDEFATTFARAAIPFDIGIDNRECGFNVRGGRFVGAFSGQARVSDGPLPAEAIEIETTDDGPRPGASVLLELDNQACAVLPAIPGFIATLTLEGAELVDVAYEPAAGNWRWDQYQNRADELRTLRALAASSTHNGVFRLSGADAEKLARRMQYAKGLDPAMAIYAAYAYHDLALGKLIRNMAEWQYDDLGAVFFDIALLGGQLDADRVGSDPQIMGFMPLLSQGWSQLSAYRIGLPGPLQGLQRMLLDSPWTLFNQDGADPLRRAIDEGIVR